ncbi:MAG: hypothetical protein QNJ06_14625 [Kiloniellales bacterium]|nr:hypothetical protein [Kiloniellales bacterium]
MIWRGLLVGLLGLSLVACAKRTSPAELAASWVGYPVGDLVANWGVPDKIEDDTDGQRIYSWHAERRVVQPPQCSASSFRSAGPCFPGRVMTRACDFAFKADTDGRILSASGRGDCMPLRRFPAPQF